MHSEICASFSIENHAMEKNDHLPADFVVKSYSPPNLRQCFLPVELAAVELAQNTLIRENLD